MGRPRTARAALPEHVRIVRAKGREYYYYQPNRGTPSEGKRVKLAGVPFNIDGTPSETWWASYRAVTQGKDVQEVAAGSFAALIGAYKASPDWQALGDKTRLNRERHFKTLMAMWGRLPVRGLESRHVLELKDAHAATPGNANNLLRSLSSIMSWSIPRGWRTYNPCAHVKKFVAGDGYQPWTMEEIEHLKATAPAHLWYVAAVALYSGQRQADVIKMLWTDIADGSISVRQNKTGKRLLIPIHAQLKVVLDSLPRLADAVLTNSRGQAWSQDGFNSSWYNELNRKHNARLRDKGLVFHGLRKSAVVFLLEAGCTDAEVSAITGQTRAIVEHYAKRVNQRKLSASAVLKWEREGAR